MFGSVVLMQVGSKLMYRLRGAWELCAMESEGHAEPALPFAGPGIAVPVPCWTLQQENSLMKELSPPIARGRVDPDGMEGSWLCPLSD